MIAVFCLCAAVTVAAQEFGPAPGEGVLVLRNGHVIRGRITNLGDRYLVTFGETGEIRLPAREVEFQCHSVEDAYWRKVETLDPRNLRQRLDLAEWCLRHDLTHRAADQLLACLSINPFDPRVQAVRRRLLHAAEAQRIVAESENAPSAELDWEAVEAALAETPPEAVEMFTSSIQSLLLNRCGTNACHGSQSKSAFHLLRPLTDKSVLPRRLTQRNLYSTLQEINPDDPDNSSLLTVPRGPHGGEPEGLFAGRQERQWEQLRDWVRLAVKSKPKRDARPADLSAVPGSQHDGSPTAFPPSEIHRRVASRPTAPDEAPPKFVPRDPFDPEIFNRRYFPEKETPSMANSPAEPASRK